MRQSDRLKLIAGPYRSPRLSIGSRTTCHVKGDVIVTSWTHARISWPRCHRIGAREHPSFLVDDELARAIRTEAAVVLRHWWGVSVGVVWRWRKALGVGRFETEGSQRLNQAAVEAGGAAAKKKQWTDGERAARRLLAIEQDFGAQGNHTPIWTADELALLGTMPDKEVAAQIGKSREAVRAQRVRRSKKRKAE